MKAFVLISVTATSRRRIDYMIILVPVKSIQ